jgi:hypothetical protein
MTPADSPQMRKPPEPDKRGDFHETYKEIVPMEELKFIDPPRDARAGKSPHQSFADALKSRPGEWALIAESSPSPALAGNIKRGRLLAYNPPGAFEAVTRRTAESGRFDIYARYVGGDPA